MQLGHFWGYHDDGYVPMCCKNGHNIIPGDIRHLKLHSMLYLFILVPAYVDNIMMNVFAEASETYIVARAVFLSTSRT